MSTPTTLNPSNIFTPDVLGSALTYQAYLQLTDDLVAAGRTTGGRQSEALIEYTKLNRQRMNRLGKQLSLTDDMKATLAAVARPMLWVVLTEPWCGDAAHNLPGLNAMAAEASNIDMVLLLRDEHPQLMDQFLTNGGRSIPKLVAIDADQWELLGTWGPRPAPAQEILSAAKAQKAPDMDKVKEQLQKWYNQDKSATLQSEMAALIQQWAQPDN